MPCSNCSKYLTRSGRAGADCAVRKPYASCDRCIQNHDTCKFTCRACRVDNLSCDGNPYAACSNCQGSKNRVALRCVFEGVKVVDALENPKKQGQHKLPIQPSPQPKDEKKSPSYRMHNAKEFRPTGLRNDHSHSSSSRSTNCSSSHSQPFSSGNAMHMPHSAASIQHSDQYPRSLSGHHNSKHPGKSRPGSRSSRHGSSSYYAESSRHTTSPSGFY